MRPFFSTATFLASACACTSLIAAADKNWSAYLGDAGGIELNDGKLLSSLKGGAIFFNNALVLPPPAG